MTQSNHHQHPDSIYSDHLINQIHANLDLLLQQDKISHHNVDIIKGSLPSPSHGARPALRQISSTPNEPTPSPAPQPPASGQNIHPHPHSQAPSFPIAAPPPPPPPPQQQQQQFKQAKALWAYRGSAADDLSFEKGDIIVILSEENQDWWRGQLLNSQQPGGLFPSNHVEIISVPPQSNAPTRAHIPPHQSMGSYDSPSSQPHSGWQQAPGYGQPPQYTDSKAPYQAPPPPMQHTQSAPAPVHIQVEKPKKNFLQGRFGQALAGGAGFGAGSAVASHVVNAIL